MGYKHLRLYCNPYDYFFEQGNTTFSVKQFQLKNVSHDKGISASTLLQLIEDVVRLQRNTGGGPVVVHCR